MSRAIMFQGTASDVGKSVLVAGICRILAQNGYRCVPFKAQNMALNSGITRSGDEMGRAQIFQAEAAGVEPDVRMNPVLLKPTGDRHSQVIVMGKVLTNMDAVTYHEFKPQLQQKIFRAFTELAEQNDIVVLEGAGSPAEINLRDRDIVNMGMAELINAPVILIADIDRGGVFASIYGTLMLLSEQERQRVRGVIINKFRGDVELLKPGIKQIEALTQVPVIGVVPYLDVDLEEEDGVALQPEKLRHQLGIESDADKLDIAVIKVPRISNFTDFNALAAQPDVNLRYVAKVSQLGNPDLIILPGSKNTLADLTHLNECGLSSAIVNIAKMGCAVLGVCGGYQMLGKTLIDGVESGIDQMDGLGLLDTVTKFAQSKHTTQVKGKILSHSRGLFCDVDGMELSGYEIHMGETEVIGDMKPFVEIRSRNQQNVSILDGAVTADGLIAGTYIHGLFDHGLFTRHFLNQLRLRKGLTQLAEDAFDYASYKSAQFDLLADGLREVLDIDQLERIMDEFSLTLANKEQECMV
ncbi:cobyric acid synthase [Vibrio plantisponsor]|jgi:adenosylcobyric acid synthase|uniref:Cobyric acid synthase n=1 Tax=Vibrio diazotrophicus TaxID=685 RepID=A0A2J8GMP0_VIBDI|nr:cobyric acid synthase [Vibrio diazotrophicus]PNH87291.1 cobyric acid synthase CobQ [Vibrio diazotrophicus]RAS60577.1 adenosylcobyric acid synthase (glutamine-hydrolysing) [Vibrio diazotrophicus]